MPPKKKASSNSEVGLKKTDKNQRIEYNKLKKTLLVCAKQERMCWETKDQFMTMFLVKRVSPHLHTKASQISSELLMRNGARGTFQVVGKTFDWD